MTNKKENKREDVFRVPENYFEEFTERVTNEVKSEKSKGKVRFLDIVKPHLMLAASMVAIFLVSYTLLRLFLPELDRSSNGITQNDIEDLLLYEMNEEEMFELLAGMGNQDYPGDSFERIPDEDIIDYLMESEIYYEEIIQLKN